MFSLALIAALAAAALTMLVAGGASAANLRTTGFLVPVGTTLHATQESGSVITSTTDGSTIVSTCTISTILATVSSTGGSTVTANIDKVVSQGCTVLTQILVLGTLHIDAAGTVTGSGTTYTVNTGVSCRYGYGSGTHLGTLNTGKLAMNAVIVEQEPKQFLCPDTTKWVANYVFTSPHDLTAA